MTTKVTSEKLDELGKLLKNMGSIVVAYSGGVDSTFLAAVAHQKLGNNSIAVIASSPSLPPGELENATNIAETIGLNYRIIQTYEVEEPGYAENGPRRCYFCKQHLYKNFRNLANEEGYLHVIDGATIDDKNDFRPGAAAARELNIRSPLIETGLTKKEIRSYSKEMGLPTWDKPAQACLSSRVPYGTPVTIETLNQISEAERFLHEVGIQQLRVRHHGNTARIEVSSQDMKRLIQPDLRQQIVDRFKKLGYLYVSIDLEPYQTGNLNRELRPRTQNSRINP